MAVPLLDVARQHQPLRAELEAAFARVLASGKFVIPSPEVDALECSLAGLCGTRWAWGMSSGTDALLAALMALDIGPGDEVITTPFTFFATAGCIARVGAKPVFVDIDPQTYNIDSRRIAQAITRQTRAIMPVHLYGQMAEMGPIMDLARKHGLAVIEDAAQAIGAQDAGKPAGSWGDIGCLSFYPTKNLAALGDAGACVTQDEKLAHKLKAIRLHGQTGEYQHEVIGGNFRLDSIQAALLNVKVPLLAGWTQARQRVAQRYDALLQGLPVKLPYVAPGKHHVFNQYTLRVPDGRRDALRKHLLEHKIGCRVYYPLPLHLQPCFAYLGGRAGQLPEAEKAAAEVLSLPMFPELTEAQQAEVAQGIREFYARG